jgi:hypothetical protein
MNYEQITDNVLLVKREVELDMAAAIAIQIGQFINIWTKNKGIIVNIH